MTARRINTNFYSQSNQGSQHKRAQNGHTQWHRLLNIHAGLTRFLQGIDISSFQQEDGTILDFTPKILPTVDYNRLSQHTTPYPAEQTLVGWGEDQQPCFIDISSAHTEHLFIASQHASGKTALLRTILLDMARQHKPSQRQFVICSGFGVPPLGKQESGLTLFDELPHVLGMSANNIAEAGEMVQFVKHELNHRQNEHTGFPVIYLAIDNVQDVIKLCGSDCLSALISIAAHGPDFGIKLILSTNRPEDSRIQDILDAGQFIRIVGRMSDETMSEIATNRLNIGAESFGKKGQFVLITEESVRYFVAAFVEEAFLRATLDAISQQRSPVLLAQAFYETHRFSAYNRLEDDQSNSEKRESKPENKSHIRPSTLRLMQKIEADHIQDEANPVDSSKNELPENITVTEKLSKPIIHEPAQTFAEQEAEPADMAVVEPIDEVADNENMEETVVDRFFKFSGPELISAQENQYDKEQSQGSPALSQAAEAEVIEFAEEIEEDFTEEPISNEVIEFTEELDEDLAEEFIHGEEDETDWFDLDDEIETENQDSALKVADDDQAGALEEIDQVEPKEHQPLLPYIKRRSNFSNSTPENEDRSLDEPLSGNDDPWMSGFVDEDSDPPEASDAEKEPQEQEENQMKRRLSKFSSRYKQPTFKKKFSQRNKLGDLDE